MAKDVFTLTSEGYEQLKNELKQLSTVEYPKVLDQMNRARELGDLRENEAYHSARSKLAMLKGRIEELEVILENAQVIEKQQANGTAVVGSNVTIVVSGRELTYTLVGEHEADLNNGKISTDSPIGKALLGSKIGETIHIEAPSGIVTYEVKSIS
jgi:transcription elongation factor GreA